MPSSSAPLRWKTEERRYHVGRSTPAEIQPSVPPRDTKISRLGRHHGFFALFQFIEDCLRLTALARHSRKISDKFGHWSSLP